MDEILRCDHSNETSFPVLSYCAIYYTALNKIANFLEISLWPLSAVKGLNQPGTSHPCSPKASSTRIRIFFNLQLFRLPSTRILLIRHTNPQLFESAPQSGHFWRSYESGIVWTVNPDMYFFSSSHTRLCRAQCFRLFTSKTSVSSLITWVQLNLAIITVHFNYAKRWRGHSQASFDVGRTNWMPIKNLKEQTNAWWDIFVSENAFFFFCGRMVITILH